MSQSTLDTRTVRRVGIAACVVAGPALIGLVRATYPPFTASNDAQTISSFAHHAGAARVELAAGLLACLVIPVFVLGVYRLTVRRAPVLATIGAVIGFVGWLMTSFMIAADALAFAIARHGASATIYHQFTNSGVIVAGTAIFLIGHEIGTLLLGFALWRSRAVAAWAAVGFIAAPLVHFLAVMASVRALDIVAFTVLTVAAAAAARAIVATPDSDWDFVTDRPSNSLPRPTTAAK